MSPELEDTAIAIAARIGLPTLYRDSLRNLKALEITETELKLMAAAAMMGLSSSPMVL